MQREGESEAKGRRRRRRVLATSGTWVLLAPNAEVCLGQPLSAAGHSCTHTHTPGTGRTSEERRKL